MRIQTFPVTLAATLATTLALGCGGDDGGSATVGTASATTLTAGSATDSTSATTGTASGTSGSSGGSGTDSGSATTTATATDSGSASATATGGSTGATGGATTGTTGTTGGSTSGVTAGTTGSTTGTTGATGGTTGGVTATTGGTGGGSGTGGGVVECDPNQLPTPDANLTGTVYAPNMVIPISGALVYLTSDPVDPIPDGVYCDECVTLSCDTHFVLTNPDGSFDLPAVAGAGQKLVVRKGQFLRVVDFNVAAGNNPVPTNQSNLPGQWNPAGGEWIPRIAVYDTSPDKVGNVLAKFGMGQVNAFGNLVAGTEQFDFIDDNDQGAFMDNAAAMNQYHIVFVPCAATKYWVGAPNVPANRIQVIQDYVAAGGKWYATDHSNEYIKEPFPMYQDFYSPGMPDIQPAYTSVGTVLDADMLAWLNALPANLKDIGGGNATLNMLPQVETRLNYTGIDAVNPVLVDDGMGGMVDVGHKTWVEGPCQSCAANPNIDRPMAISGQYGCGRMMYSTFENSSSAHVGLNPQELILLYMILEIGICFEEPPLPPPQ